ncbi:putative N-acetylglucosaminyl-phosphatidylinositol biosynthetic protein [Pseudorhizobium banfieldiae]|uniref:Putative N-acetylglucosaminyl-phosphatidylinositol biosynthetic protein n=2 Tax=Pseudorhizobium banfieldiae TaxID=1125847 RepID=L0NDD5_9HYPH|nr:glycosyltransferase family 1 protein [arsenite-oxidising bacterium NT-25]CCF18317.1 putative N-acetylglucosaminyl-phosphatidylinositol biosynthetic protein [Pseudorhizobium banfieldiae]
MHLLALAKNLQQQGIEPVIVTSFPGPPEIDGVPIDRIDCFRLPIVELAASPQLVGKLRDSFAEGRYDTIHIHPSIVAPLCLAAVPAARFLDLPIVVTFHSVMRKLPLLLSVIERATGWCKGRLILSAVSNLVAGQIRTAMPKVPVRVLPNGFEHGLWHAEGLRRAQGGGQLRLVSALRLQPRKRCIALVDAFAESAAEASSRRIDLTLTIAGDGPLRARLEQRIAKTGLQDRILLAGWLSREELRSLYAESSLFVMPSLKEAFCIAALEARAAGLPVLAMEGTGIADFVHSGVSGILVKNDMELAGEITALAADPQRLQKLAMADPGLARYDWQALAAEHIALYRESHGFSSPSPP